MAIVIGEAARLRNFLYYGVGGAVVGLASYYGTNISVRLENTTDVAPVTNALQLAAAAGIVGGLVYWLIAGRNAGRWREPRHTKPAIIRDRNSSAFHLAVRRLDEPRMNRTGLLIALAIAVVAGLAFGLYPELDLRIAGYFYGFEDPAHNQICLPFVSAADAGARRRPLDRNDSGGAGRCRAGDQTVVSTAQAADVGPRGRFPDCNDGIWRRLDGECAAQGSLGAFASD
jgi:hypothetical protein